MRSALYSLTQGTMTVKDFVHYVQDSARGLNMEERGLVSIIINGVHPNIKFHMIMDRPQTTADIIKSPASQPNLGGAINMDPSASFALTIQEELRAVRRQPSQLTLAQQQFAQVATLSTETTEQHTDRHVHFRCSSCERTTVDTPSLQQ